jgi:chromosome segregation ATPase
MDAFQSKSLLTDAEEALKSMLLEYARSGDESLRARVDLFEAVVDRLTEAEKQIEQHAGEVSRLEDQAYDLEEKLGDAEARIEQLVEDIDDLRERLEA